MNAKQKRFCDEYLIDTNAAQAALRAGYSPKSAKQMGHHLLHDVPETREYIAQQLAALHEQRSADAQEVVEYLTAVMRGDETEPDGSGAEIKERLKAAELLGRRHGLFTDRVSLDVQPVLLINDLPPEDSGVCGTSGTEKRAGS